MLVVGCPSERTRKFWIVLIQEKVSGVWKVVCRSARWCRQVSSGGGVPNVFRCRQGMWYDSSEFSTTTFQFARYSVSQVHASRNGGANQRRHSSWNGPK